MIQGKYMTVYFSRISVKENDDEMKFNIVYQANLIPMAILKEQLEKFDINYVACNHGEIDILDEISEDHYKQLELSLGKYSIEILYDQKSQLVQRIKNILQEVAYDENQQLLTLSDYLSNQLGLSYGYISYVFTTQTFTSIENFVIMLKIERAKKLIIEGVQSIKEISYTLNYSSVGHFSRQFKKTTGLTISVFKKIVNNRKSKRTVIK